MKNKSIRRVGCLKLSSGDKQSARLIKEVSVLAERAGVIFSPPDSDLEAGVLKN